MEKQVEGIVVSVAKQWWLKIKNKKLKKGIDKSKLVA